jgi:acid phosphatase family membrane protein YuiD
MSLFGLLNNPVLVSALIAWVIAQATKVPIEYVRTHRWDWALLFRAGGMPSSHAALVTAAPACGWASTRPSSLWGWSWRWS